MKKFEKDNPDISRTMKTHFIGDFDRFGILENDYEKFFQARARAVSRELQKRIIEQKTGNEQYDESSETEIEEQEPELEVED